MSINRQTYKIQLKRTDKAITNSDITNAELYYGEPLYMDTPNYLIVGKKPSGTDETTLVPDNKVIKAINRQALENGSYIPVADNPVFYKNKDTTSNIVNLMDEDANTLYPRTIFTAVTDPDNTGINVATLLVNKVKVDENSSVQLLAMGYDNTQGAIYFTEYTASTSGVSSDILAMINTRVAIDSNSYYQILSLGYDNSNSTLYVQAV